MNYVHKQRNIFSGTKYSEWQQVPEDRSTSVKEIVNGRKFQIRTDKKIDASNDIRWTLVELGGFKITSESISANRCKNKVFTGTEKFLKQGGDMTFLITTSPLQLWFNDVLEVDWIYEDSSDTDICILRREFEGLKFETPNTKEDKVTTKYRYEPGNILFKSL